MTGTLFKTPLHALHVELGGKMVPFAGYDMPVQYPLGIMGEHKHTREKAGLFDVSHMGQARYTGDEAALEAREREWHHRGSVSDRRAAAWRAAACVRSAACAT